MTITSTKNTVMEITPDNPLFHFADGMVLYPRAAIKVSTTCPTRHTQFITHAMQEGWLTVNAYMPHDEVIAITLAKIAHKSSIQQKPKNISAFRTWIHHIWEENSKEHQQYGELPYTKKEYFNMHMWWLKKQYRLK